MHPEGEGTREYEVPQQHRRRDIRKDGLGGFIFADFIGVIVGREGRRTAGVES